MLKQSSKSAFGFILASISAISYGLIPLFALPIINKDINLESILFFRFIIASVFIGIVMVIKKISFKVTFSQFLTLCALGIFFIGSSYFLFLSYKHMTSGMATSILFVYPIMVALLMRFIFKEKLKPITFICMFVAIVGVFVLYAGDSSYISLLGLLFILLSALTYSFYIVVINKSNVNALSSMTLTFYSMLFTSIIYFIIAILGKGLQIPQGTSAWLNLSLLGIVATSISCVTLASAILLIGSTRTAVLGALDPVTAVIVGIFVFSEPFTIYSAIGIILILAAVTIMVGWSRFKEFVAKIVK